MIESFIKHCICEIFPKAQYVEYIETAVDSIDVSNEILRQSNMSIADEGAFSFIFRRTIASLFLLLLFNVVYIGCVKPIAIILFEDMHFPAWSQICLMYLTADRFVSVFRDIFNI